MHIFKIADSDVYAFTADQCGNNLPMEQVAALGTDSGAKWVFVETLEPLQVAWGEQELQEVVDTINAQGYFAFVGTSMTRQ